jgi:hypothetical protein
MKQSGKETFQTIIHYCELKGLKPLSGHMLSSVDLAAIKYYHFVKLILQDLIMLLFLLQVTPVQEVLKFNAGICSM